MTEVRDADTLVYYAYNYRSHVKCSWCILRRWDNSHEYPHIDVYDEDGVLKEKIVDKERNLVEIKGLIRSYEERGVWFDRRD